MTSRLSLAAIPLAGLALWLGSARPAQANQDRKLAAGTNFSILIRDDGIYGTGTNSNYQLGLGMDTAQRAFRRIVTGTWRHVDCGNSYTYALKSDSTLWGWGNEATTSFWGDSVTHKIPKQMGTDHWRTVVAGGQRQNDFGIKGDGTLWAWGNNGNGALGNGGSSAVTTPVQIGTDTWLDIAAQLNFSLGIKSDSSLWIWGYMGGLSLGDVAATINSLVPISVGTGHWRMVAVNNYGAYAIQSDGTLWRWGYGGGGGMGNGSTASITNPTQLGTDSWLSIVANATNTGSTTAEVLGLKADSTLWGWGLGSSGQLGNGTTTSTNTAPVQVPNSKWREVALGATHALGIDSSGAFKGWGANTTGAVGDSTVTSPRTSPRSVVFFSTLTPQTISFGALAGKSFGDPDYAPGATASSGLTVAYASSNASVATIVSGQIHIVGVGSTNITASQAGDTTYASAANVVQSLTVGKASQSLTFSALSAKAFGDADFSPGGSASSGLAVSYASSDTLVASILSGQIHIVGPGTATITASQAGNGNYDSATSVTQSLTVNKAAQIITFSSLPAKTFGDGDYGPGASASSGLTISYASSDTTVATLVSNQIHIVGAGTTTITASQAGNGNYDSAASVAQSLTVGKAAQSITFGSLAAKAFGDVDYAPGASANSGLSVTYVSSNTAVATIVSNQIHIVGAGTATITASQAGNGNYDSAASVAQSLTVGKAAQSITFGSLAAKAFGDADYAPGASANSGLSVTYVSSNAAVATIVSNQIHIVGAGTATITASQAGNGNYDSAASVAQSLTIGKASQSITFGSLAAKAFGDADYAPGASANSGLSVTYVSSDTAVATIVSNQIHIVGTGTTAITASQAGNGNYDSAASVAQSLTVGKASQSITFGSLAAKAYGDADYAPGASANSGLSVTYSSSNTSVATIVANQIHIVGAGTTTITASQTGNGSYDSATSAAQSLTVGKAAQSITFGSLASKAFGGADFAPGGSASSGLVPSYASSNPAVATIVANQIHIVSAGTTTITASQAGNGNYDTAASVSQSLVVGKSAQAITFAPLAAKTFGDADFALGASANSGLSVAYASSNPSVATIVANQIHIVGPGATAITAIQSGNGNYDSASSVSQSLTVGKAAQSIAFSALSPRTFGAEDFAPGASASSGLTVTYSSSDASVASIVSNQIHIVGAGTTTITASQAGNANYDSAASMGQSLAIGRAAQSIAFESLPAKTFGDADFAPGASASTGLDLGYASSDASVATIVANRIHIVGAGTATITASQPGDASHEPAANVERTLTVGKAAQAIAFAAISPKLPLDADFAPGATCNSGLPVAYSSSDTLVAKIAGGLIHIVGVGATVITASQPGNADYASALSVGQSLTVGKAPQTISFPALSARVFGNADFSLGASSGSGLPVGYSSSNPLVATIVNGQAHIVGAGTTTLTASQPGNGTYDAAPDVTRDLIVAKAEQTLQFAEIPPQAFGDSDFALAATATSGLSPVFGVSDTAVAKIVSGKIHVQGEGIAEVTASQGGSADYDPAPDVVRTLTVGRAPQSLVFELAADSLKTEGDARFRLVAISSAGIPVAFSSSDTAVAKVAGDSVTISKAGTASITAAQAGNRQYASAAPVTRQIRVQVAAPIAYAVDELFRKGGTASDTSAELSWRKRPLATGYRFQASLDTGKAEFFLDSVLSDTALILGKLPFGAAVSWRVSPSNATGAAGFSPYASFAVRPRPPLPLDVSRIPTLSEGGVGSQVELAWPKAEGSTGYHVQVSLDIALPPALDTVVAGPSLTLKDLPSGSTRFWRVAPVNGVSEAPFIPWLSFKVKETDNGAVTRSAVVDSAKPEPVQVSPLVGLTAKDSTLSDVKVTLTEAKQAPANLPPGFLPLTGRIELDAKTGSIEVMDNQVSITLTAPDTALDGSKLNRADIPMVYLLDSATGGLEAVYDLERDSSGRILLPLSKGKSFLLALDTVAPVVKDSTPPEAREPGSSPVISGVVEDNIRNCRTWLRYRQGGSETFDSVSVAIDATGHFEIPLDLKLDDTGFEYNLSASDGRNRNVTHSLDLPVSVKAMQAADSLPSMQWRLFALPTIANESQWSDMASTLGTYGKDWKLFERAPEGLREFGPSLRKAEPGIAYWLKSRTRGFQPAITGGVAAPISKPFVIALPPRTWRSFGNPFLFPVAWQSVLDSSQAGPGALVGPYTFRDSSWVAPLEIPVLAPWEGYYAYNPSSDTVYIRIPSIKAKTAAAPMAKAAFHLQWQVRGADGKDAGNFFGALPVRPAAKTAAAAPSRTQWNTPKPQSPEATLRAGFVAPEGNPGLMQTDFRSLPAEGGAGWTARLEGLKPGQRYASRFLGLDALPQGVAVGLADSATGHFEMWSPDAVYLMEAQAGETARNLRFYAGSREYVVAQGIAFTAAFPASIELGNYPNPARSFTMVRFAIPARAAGIPQAKLTIYDMRGRRIRTLVDARMGAGRHSLRWDVRDEGGRRVAAGMYRLVLEAAGERLSRALQVSY